MRPVDRLRGQWDRVRAARADVRATRARADHLVATTNQLAAGTDAIAADLAACRAEIYALHQRVEALATAAGEDRARLLDALRVVRDDDERARARLWALRNSPEYALAYDDPDPLVSIIVTTYHNWQLMRDRCLPSLLAQTHENIEVIVIGDAAPPEAGETVAAFGDPRLRYVNLPYNGPYPEDPRSAWLVSGTTPWNTGLALARGRWIASNSDDDAFRPDLVSSLLDFARAERAEVPYGLITQLEPGGGSTQLGGFPPRHGQWGTQASLLHAGLRFMPMHPSDWMFGVPNDSSLLQRMLRIGVRFAMLEQPVVDYYPSTLWNTRPEAAER